MPRRLFLAAVTAAAKSGTADRWRGAADTHGFRDIRLWGSLPPPGKPHRYVFTLSALDIDKLPVPDDASGALVGFNVGAHTLAKATITAMSGR